MAVGHPLPIDIIEYVLDFLWDDQDALLQCTRLCHATYVRSMRMLYSRVTFGSANMLEQVLQDVNRSAQSVAFARFRSTHSLHIGNRRKDFGKLENESPWRLRSFLALTSIFGSIEALHLANLSLRTQQGRLDAIAVAFPLFRAVTRLEMSNLYLRNIHHFQRLICAFPCLAHLRIEDVHFVHPNRPRIMVDPAPLRPILARPALKTLVLEDRSFPFNFFQWLMQTPTVRHLEMFQFHGPISELAQIREFMRSVAPHLRDLRLGTGTAHDWPLDGRDHMLHLQNLIEQSQIGQCTALRGASIFMRDLKPGPGRVSLYDLILLALSPSCHIREVHLSDWIM